MWLVYINNEAHIQKGVHYKERQPTKENFRRLWRVCILLTASNGRVRNKEKLLVRGKKARRRRNCFLKSRLVILTWDRAFFKFQEPNSIPCTTSKSTKNKTQLSFPRNVHHFPTFHTSKLHLPHYNSNKLFIYVLTRHSSRFP